MRPLAPVFAAVFAAVLSLALTGPGLADIYDEADIDLGSYDVTGATLDEVMADMEANGPQGFWAYTAWNVTWDGQCQTTVTAEITMPELSDDAALSEEDRAEFDRMAGALLEHELGHVRFGVAFAAEVAAAGCPQDSDAILQHWLQEERDYDAETEHGQQQGVYLAQ